MPWSLLLFRDLDSFRADPLLKVLTELLLSITLSLSCLSTIYLVLVKVWAPAMDGLFSSVLCSLISHISEHSIKNACENLTIICQQRKYIFYIIVDSFCVRKFCLIFMRKSTHSLLPFKSCLVNASPHFSCKGYISLKE